LVMHPATGKLNVIVNGKPDSLIEAQATWSLNP
jgi:hypothetical protein